MTAWRARSAMIASAAGSAGLVALAALYALRAPEPATPFVSELSVAQGSETGRDRVEQIEIPDRVLALTLRDELFPEPPQPERAAPPPEVTLELVGILDEAGARRAFVFDPSERSVITMAVGDEAPSGPVLAALEPGAAVFELAGRRVRLELNP